MSVSHDYRYEQRLVRYVGGPLGGREEMWDAGQTERHVYGHGTMSFPKGVYVPSGDGSTAEYEPYAPPGPPPRPPESRDTGTRPPDSGFVIHRAGRSTMVADALVGIALIAVMVAIYFAGIR